MDMDTITEIFGTLGPSCRDETTLEAMFREGMDGCRLNLSHSSLEGSREWIDAFHKAAEKAGVSRPELLIDLQGPELRTGDLKKPLVIPNEEYEEVPMQKETASLLHAGDVILLDDGKMRADVCSVMKKSAMLHFQRGGTLESRKSVKILGREVSLPALTDEDLKNLRSAEDFGVTAVMEPFVTSGEQLHEVGQALLDAGCSFLRIFAKIENREGMKNLPGILEKTDVVVIARGDLGNDMDLSDLPVAQKKIAAACREEHRDFMVVTQMLASMEEHPYPTRAEVSDICNAVLDGASAVMVTGETAHGHYPVEVIRTLVKTVQAAEDYMKEAGL